MKITKSRLRMIVSENLKFEEVKTSVYEMGLRPSGVDLDTLNSLYGKPAFDAIDLLEDENLGILDDEEGIFYTVGSIGIKAMLKRRGLT